MFRFYKGETDPNSSYIKKFEYDPNDTLVSKYEVFITDLDGDNYFGLINFSEDYGRRYKKFYPDSSIHSNILFEELIHEDCAETSKKFLNIPLEKNSNPAFVDIDGDCLSDLLIQSYDTKLKKRYLEIWRGVISKNGELKYCLKDNSVYELPEKLGSFNVADINRDGMIDLVFPIIIGQPSILIAYNQIPLVFSWEDDYCEKHPYTENSFSKVFLEFDSDHKNNNIGNNINSNDPLKNQIVFLYNSQNQRFYSDSIIQTIIRIGDLNTDSFPDITFVLENEDKTREAFLFLNCRVDNSDGTSSRSFSESCDKNKKEFEFTSGNEVVYNSFFDLDENGQLDFLTVNKNSSGEYYITATYNNYNFDSFFLKSMNSLDSKKNAGISIGNTYRYIATNLDGSRRMDVSNQGVQFNNISLNLPYAFIGIGRSNNYVENFHVISPTITETSTNYKIYTPIIPNSQLLISENKVIDDQKKTSLSWVLDLIVNPTSKLPLLVVVITIILAVLLLIIIILHSQERREDKENENFSQWFN